MGGFQQKACFIKEYRNYSAGLPSLYTDYTEKSRSHRKAFGYLYTYQLPSYA